MTSAAAEPCSRLWDATALPASGTATAAAFWVAVEQPGPWPSKAVDTLAAELDAACSAAGGRTLLIRQVARDSAGTERVERTAYLAGGLASGTPWLIRVQFPGPPGVLAHLPYAAMVDARPDRIVAGLPPQARLVARPAAVLLVCTNGRRDVCCAVRGRQVAVAAASARPGQVWECTHTGGHRFAPTGVVLPYGTVYGRLTGESAVQAVDAAAVGQMPQALNSPAHDRGSSWLSPADQVRESAVRQAISEPSLTALEVEAGVVRHRDGRAWRVDVAQHEGPALPASCGKDATASTIWRASAITALD